MIAKHYAWKGRDAMPAVMGDTDFDPSAQMSPGKMEQQRDGKNTTTPRKVAPGDMATIKLLEHVTAGLMPIDETLHRLNDFNGVAMPHEKRSVNAGVDSSNNMVRTGILLQKFYTVGQTPSCMVISLVDHDHALEKERCKQVQRLPSRQRRSMTQAAGYGITQTIHGRLFNTGKTCPQPIRFKRQEANL